MAFKVAAQWPSRQARWKADPVLLEPMMKVEVVTPEEHMGDVMGDLNRRRGVFWGWRDVPQGNRIELMCPCQKCSVMRQTCGLRRRGVPPTPWNLTSMQKRQAMLPRRYIRT